MKPHLDYHSHVHSCPDPMPCARPNPWLFSLVVLLAAAGTWVAGMLFTFWLVRFVTS